MDTEVGRPSARGNLASTGPYGRGFAPFIPGKRGQLQADMKLSLPAGRFFDDRRELLRRLDRLDRRCQTAGELQVQEALRLMCERSLHRTTFGATVSTRSNVMDWITSCS